MAETQNQEKKKKLAVNKRNPIEMGINNNNKKIQVAEWGYTNKF